MKLEINTPLSFPSSGDPAGEIDLPVWFHGNGHPASRGAPVDPGRRLHRKVLHCVWQGCRQSGVCPCQVNLPLIWFFWVFFFFGKYITYSSAPNLNVNVKPRKDDIKWHHQGFDFAQSETFNDYALDWLAEPNLLCNCDSEQRKRSAQLTNASTLPY